MQDKMIQSRTNVSSQFQEIEPSLLINPVQKNGQIEDVFVGRGCFAVVKLQLFRGIKVAVKEVLPRTVLSDVHHEASIIMRLSHPYVTYLFGVCTHQHPYKIVMQFEGIANNTTTLTLKDKHHF